MGCGSSSSIIGTTWKKKFNPEEARELYLRDRSIPADSGNDQLELRALFDDAIGMKYLINFASTVNATGFINMWSYIADFKSMDPKNVKIHHLKKLYDNYLEIHKSVSPDDISDNLMTIYKALSVSSQKSGSIRSIKEFNELLREGVEVLTLQCFDSIFSNIYMPFKATYEYGEMCNDIKQSYNKVSVDDFEYLTKIGEGGFGLILHCRKISTGKNYAMKIQPKASLLRHFRKTPLSVMLEMKAYSCCSHPFVASLTYAFQTKTLGILVMPLSTCGDLSRSLRVSISGTMSLDRVRFYAAEIVSALCYLHSNGLIYRDLKPGNVLLNGDGHIMLADFGSLADMENRLHTKDPESAASPAPGTSQRSSHSVASSIFSQSHNLKKHSSCSNSAQSAYSASKSLSVSVRDSTSDRHMFGSFLNDGMNEEVGIGAWAPMDVDGPGEYHHDIGFKEKKRVISLVGTIAYMAPEIIIMFAKGDWSVDGYTDAIDWWSLGVTIYKLLVGRQPFARVSFEELQFIFPGVVAKQKTFEDAFTVVFGQLSFDNLDVELDAETKDFITKLLTFDAKHRLGVTYDGDNEHVVLKAHPFFKDINWEQLERREVVPPYDPSVDELLDSMVAVKKEEIESVKQSSSFRFSLSAKISTTTDKYTFEDVLRYYNKHAWIPESEETINDGNSREKGSQYASKASKFRLTEEQQFYFREWQYVNPNIIDEEKIVSAGRSAKNAMKRMIFG